MRGKSLVSYILPTAICHVMDGEDHLNDMVPGGEEVIWLIEQAVPQAAAYKDTYEAVDEQWVKILVLDLLLFIQPFDDKEGKDQPDQPAYRIPADTKMPHVECNDIWIPDDIVQ
jgi:hypothetical protein